MAGLLQPIEQHDLDEASGVEAFRGGVKANIAGQALFRGARVKTFKIGSLMDKSALIKNAQKIGFECSHLLAQAGVAQPRTTLRA